MLGEFLFADDMAKAAPTEGKMQKGMNQVSDSCEYYDSMISSSAQNKTKKKTKKKKKKKKKKTEVVFQPAPGKLYNEPIIIVKGQRLQRHAHLPWKHIVKNCAH